MAAVSRRAVISGIGVLSPIGLTLDSFWEALCNQRSGIRPIQAFDTSKLPVRIAGEIPDFDPRQYVEKKDRRNLRLMARTIELAVCAAQLALADGSVNKEQLEPTRFGCEFGAGLIASVLEEIGEASRLSANCQPGIVDLEKWGGAGLEAIQPLWMLKYLPNMLACHVSILHNAQGPNNTITENDVAGLLALGEAYRIIQRDQADFFLVGGAESRLNPLSMVRLCLFEPLSRRNDSPDKACRPFDRRRDGAVIGEGGTVLVLEELEHARRRGARIYAELVGYGASFDRARSGAGVARAIEAALKQAGIGPEDIDHVNTHGMGTIASDVMEARGLEQVFASRRDPVPVFAPKSYLGNLGAGASTTELAASLLALEHGLVPTSLNYDEPDPACPVHVITGAPRSVNRPFALKVSFTQMGQCAAAIVRKWE